MNLGIIGCGAIGTDVAIAADKMGEINRIYLHDINEKKENILLKKIKKSKVGKITEFLNKVDLVFEYASQKAVEQYSELILEAGKDMIIMSIGCFHDEIFKNKLEKIAKKNKCKIFIPSGAVCGIDGILSASIDTIDEVTLVTTKPPASLDKNFNRRTVLFKGNACEAVKKFPENINVAASLSLAGVGFLNTKVEIVADPVATRNSHKILAHGKFGRLRAEVENMPNPNNPKSSYMASLSAVATLKKIINPIQIGS